MLSKKNTLFGTASHYGLTTQKMHTGDLSQKQMCNDLQQLSAHFLP
jgi:hypothetical protein